MFSSIRSFVLAALALSGYINASEVPTAANLVRRNGDGDSPPGYLDGQVSWVGWTSGDGIKSGADANGVFYVKTFIEKILTAVPNSQERNMVYWAGGNTVRDDVDEFTESETRMPNGGKQFTDLFGNQILEDMGVQVNTPHYWRAINRMSKALAAAATNEKAYVYLRSECGRTIFSPPSQDPSNSDPTADGKPTNGEIWHYSELPALMRNLNIKQIYTFWKPDGSRKFEVNLAWDADASDALSRTALPDISLDETPITDFPGRGPMKRNAPGDVLFHLLPQPTKRSFAPFLVARNASHPSGTGTGSGFITATRPSTATSTGGSCPLSTPTGPFTTAWFDWAVSCEGAGCPGINSPSSVPDWSTGTWGDAASATTTTGPDPTAV